MKAKMIVITGIESMVKKTWLIVYQHDIPFIFTRPDGQRSFTEDSSNFISIMQEVTNISEIEIITGFYRKEYAYPNRIFWMEEFLNKWKPVREFQSLPITDTSVTVIECTELLIGHAYKQWTIFSTNTKHPFERVCLHTSDQSKTSGVEFIVGHEIKSEVWINQDWGFFRKVLAPNARFYVVLLKHDSRKQSDWMKNSSWHANIDQPIVCPSYWRLLDQEMSVENRSMVNSDADPMIRVREEEQTNVCQTEIEQ